MPTYLDLLELKVRVIEHAQTYASDSEASEYWWKHYWKLDKLQSKLPSGDDIPF